MQYGRLMDAALEARSERYVRDIFEQLRPVSVASRANKPIGDKMIMLSIAGVDLVYLRLSVLLCAADRIWTSTRP